MLSKSSGCGYGRPLTIALFAVIILTGTFFRFYNIDRKVYWHDEAYSSFILAGHSEQFLVKELDDKIISAEEADRYFIIPSGSSVFEPLNYLIKHEPHLTPVYFVLLKTWSKWFGGSIASLRSMSALFGVLLLPFIYLLCMELFRSKQMALIAAAIVSISPVHVLYAQETREYSLWAFIILFSSVALLRALRIKSTRSWVLYSATLILGCYSYLLFLFVALAHGVYVLFIERFCFNKNLKAYLITAAISFLAFTPWIYFILAHTDPLGSVVWISYKIPFISLAVGWGNILSRTFFDVNLIHRSFRPYHFGVIAAAALLVGYSGYYFMRNSSRNGRFFIFALLIIPIIPLVIPDLIFGGIRSKVLRYCMPGILCIEIIVAYFLAHKLKSREGSSNYLVKIILVLLIGSGLLSCIISSQSRTWWTKHFSKNDPLMAEKIGRSQHPLVVMANKKPVVEELALARLLDPRASIYWSSEFEYFAIPERFDVIYFIGMTENLKKRLERDNYSVKQVLPEKLDLWKVTRG